MKRALVGTEIGGCSLELLHANDSTAALAVLRRETNIAVTIIDACLEGDITGLALAKTARDDLLLKGMRIIVLPTPQEANSSATAGVPSQTRSDPSSHSDDDLRQQTIDAVRGYQHATSLILAPFNDELTGLLNRNGFLSIVKGALDGPRSGGLGVALVDLNDFAAFNDAFGHDKGDALLRAVAVHLAAQVTDAIVVARIGNDVFGVLYPSEANITVDVHRAVRAACAHAGADITMTCSIGTATTDHGARSGSEVLRQASIALTTSKRTGPGRQACFNTNMGTLTVKRVTLLQHLHNALPQCQLSVVYQPQVDLNDDRAIGVEALMRWSTSDGSAISPTQFIPLAESAGLIVSFGEWILEEACLELRALHRLGGPLLRMSVNVSPMQFESEGFVASVLRIVQETGVDPRYLELEVTESTTMKNPASVFRQLTDLRRHGISVAIDDFGTGHSCLGSLRNLPVNRLKLDQSFVQDVGITEQCTSIAQLVINLGRSLNLEVVAEGIETRAIAQALKTMGCRVGQGFYFAAPMDSTALRAWLALRRKIAA